jgi:alkylation response protein AidB-like acyl-CoA dehydrogenase
MLPIGTLVADTTAGATMVDAAATFAQQFADGARAHDLDGTFAVEHLDKLRADGYLVAPVPSLFGGGGVTSVHDVLVAAASEPAPQDLTRPATTATRIEGGWVVNGRKAFATMAPFATMLNVAVSFVDGAGRDRYGFAFVPTAGAGVIFHDDWNALGMRASASGSVSFQDVRLGREAVSDGFPAGEWSAALMERYLVSGAFHIGASLGIAEAAHGQVVTSLRRRASAGLADPHVVGELAANVVDLSAMRASFDRAGRLIDVHHDAHPRGDPSLESAQAIFGEVQASKAFVADAAVRVVDRALALSGGAGYLASHPLAKAWRDVRAGGFMHPIGANRAGPFLARTELGVEPA